MEKPIENLKDKVIARIWVHLNFCKRYNGLPYCKNCGLGEDDIEYIEKLFKDYVSNRGNKK